MDINEQYRPHSHYPAPILYYAFFLQTLQGDQVHKEQNMLPTFNIWLYSLGRVEIYLELAICSGLV